MKRHVFFIITGAIIAIVAGLTASVYPRLPEMVASHWNASGQIDGYMPRGSIFFIPILAAVFSVLLYFLPYTDPSRKDVEESRDHYDIFIIALVLFLSYIHGVMVLINLGYALDMSAMMPPGFGALFIVLGIAMRGMKKNWFFGVRTPWTLSSDKVWSKTNQMASKLFIACGVLAILGAFMKSYSFLFIIVPAVGSAIFLTVYSYVLYRRR